MCAATFCNITSCNVNVMLVYVVKQHHTQRKNRPKTKEKLRKSFIFKEFREFHRNNHNNKPFKNLGNCHLTKQLHTKYKVFSFCNSSRKISISSDCPLKALSISLDWPFKTLLPLYLRQPLLKADIARQGSIILCVQLFG